MGTFWATARILASFTFFLWFCSDPRRLDGGGLRALCLATKGRCVASGTYLIPHGALELVFQGLIAAWSIELVGDPVIAGRRGNVRHAARRVHRGAGPLLPRP